MKKEIEEIIKYLDENIFIGENSHRNSRKRKFIDPRNYAIGVLASKYDLTEEMIAEELKIPRLRVHWGKHQAFQHRRDDQFIENTAKIRNEFPYIFIDPEKKSKNIARRNSVSVALTGENLMNLDKYRKEQGIKSRHMGVALNRLLTEYFKQKQ